MSKGRLNEGGGNDEDSTKCELHGVLQWFGVPL